MRSSTQSESSFGGSKNDSKMSNFVLKIGYYDQNDYTIKFMENHKMHFIEYN